MRWRERKLVSLSTRKEEDPDGTVARELQTIFNEMIVAPRYEIVPHRELARLTILKSSEDSGSAGVAQTVDGGGEGLGDINGSPILGPANKPTPESRKRNHSLSLILNQSNSDNVSEDTLVADTDMADAETPARNVPNEQDMSDAKEITGQTPNTEYQMTELVEAAHKTPLPETNPPNVAANTVTNSVQVSQSDLLPSIQIREPDSSVDAAHPPPSRPPPMPPRPNQNQTQSKGPTFGEIENIAQQRDVTEVIGNVLFQLECAIVPTSFQPDGEQWDLIKE